MSWVALLRCKPLVPMLFSNSTNMHAWWPGVNMWRCTVFQLFTFWLIVSLLQKSAWFYTHLSSIVSYKHNNLDIQWHNMDDITRHDVDISWGTGCHGLFVCIIEAERNSDIHEHTFPCGIIQHVLQSSSITGLPSVLFLLYSLICVSEHAWI
jgi:hypothetical protein